MSAKEANLVGHKLLKSRLQHLLCFCSSCPYFRNEVGGEGERIVALTRETAAKRFQAGQPLGAMSGSGGHEQVPILFL